MPEASWPVPTGHETWAHWRMPTPDAAIAPESSTPLPNAMAYDAGADAGSPVVYDVETQLTWYRMARPATTYEQAWSACAGLPGGLTTWRLPTRIELVSLIDFTRPSGTPTLDTATFLEAGAARTWSSSAVAGDDSPSGYWVVDLATGLTATGGQGTQVLCVSGTTP
jgi:hypothetical protein